MRKVFVDGAAGTVGSALQPYLDKAQAEGLIQLIGLPEGVRKAQSARQDAMCKADLVVLCLPDNEAGEAIALLESVNPGARVLDASAAHRCQPEWVYGLPEVSTPQAIATAQKVANPGCFATACILAGKPLVDAFGVSQLSFQGITGYSAGGRKAHAEGMPLLAQFGKAHRHLPEIARYTNASPVLTTMVGPWRQGMLVQSYVDQDEVDVFWAYQNAYQGLNGIFIRQAFADSGRVDPQSCNGTNNVLISVAGQPNGGTSVAVVLDNLGKGSAGAAAANLSFMLLGEFMK